MAVKGDTFDPAGPQGLSFAAPLNPISGNVTQFSFDSPATPGVVTGQTIAAAFRANIVIGLPGVSAAVDAGDLTYVHFLCDRHGVVLTEGAPCESLYPGPMAMKALPATSVAEILALFPELAGFDSPLMVPARPFANGRQGRSMAERHLKNRVALLAA